MSEIEVRLMEPEEWELAAPMILPFWRKLVREEASVFGAWCGEELCGALGVLSEENMLVLLSVYVKE